MVEPPYGRREGEKGERGEGCEVKERMKIWGQDRTAQDRGRWR
jgi:hypothetical protein